MAGSRDIVLVRQANSRKIDWHLRAADGQVYHGTEGTFSAALDAATAKQEQVIGNVTHATHSNILTGR
jgi:hydroxymethylpyrimidine/phosphomethylpyrimidine kinase